MSEIQMAPCNECARPTRHFVRAEYGTLTSHAPGVFAESHAVLECGGCGTVCFRTRQGFDSHDSAGSGPPFETFYPARLHKEEPLWFVDLSEDLQEVLGETYDAFYNEQGYLCAVGIRTVLDMATVEKIGDAGTFRDKLDLLNRSGLIDLDDVVMLTAVVEAGNAAAHRGFRPPRSDLTIMMQIMERVLHQLFVHSEEKDALKASAEEVKGRVPPRRPRGEAR